MLTSQVIRGVLEDMRTITRVQFCVQDPDGNTVAATEEAAVQDPALVRGFARSAVDSQIIGDSYLMKILDEGQPCYILTATGSSEHTFLVAKMVVSQLQTLLAAYKDRLDRGSFFQNLLLDNLLLVDIHNRARKLHIVNAEYRAVILFEISQPGTAGGPEEESFTAASELLSGLFSSQSGDFLVDVEDGIVAVIKSLSSPDDYEELEKCAAEAVDIVEAEAMVGVRAAYGTIVGELHELSKSYKEAHMAMDVGQIFYAGRRVLSYYKLGIGRLIYQLPVTLCRMFLHETLGEYDPALIDNETLTTIRTFFENNLNVSETARKLFIHRNTLVYRLEKLQKSTGLDIRAFDDAMTFRLALMVGEYMKFLERKR